MIQEPHLKLSPAPLPITLLGTGLSRNHPLLPSCHLWPRTFHSLLCCPSGLSWNPCLLLNLTYSRPGSSRSYAFIFFSERLPGPLSQAAFLGLDRGERPTREFLGLQISSLIPHKIPCITEAAIELQLFPCSFQYCFFAVYINVLTTIYYEEFIFSSCLLGVLCASCLSSVWRNFFYDPL